MKIYQILPTLAYGDGVGNDVMAIYKLLKREGYDTEIYAEAVDRRIECEDLYEFHQFPELNEDDVVINHLSVGSDINLVFPDMKARKMIIYHNITPAEWFKDYDENAYHFCNRGYEETRKLASTVSYCLADSAYNRQDLIDMGYTCDIDVLPIIISFDDFKQEPHHVLLDKLNDGMTNIIFTGRIAPNKRQPDVVKAFAAYQKKYNPNSRLTFVGAYGEGAYMDEIRKTIEETGAQNVSFSGHVPFSKILSYYHSADLFLCMSEHEGFCIPLLEAMYFDIPVVAYNKAAVGETIGGCGVLVDEKNYDQIADSINKVLTDEEYRESIVEKQRQRIDDFAYEKSEQKFLTYLRKFLDEVK